MASSNKENSDDTYESSTGGEASADYIIRGAGEGDGTKTSSSTSESDSGITDKIKDKIKELKTRLPVLQTQQLIPLKKASLLALLLTNKTENMKKVVLAPGLIERKILLKNMMKKNQCLRPK